MSLPEKAAEHLIPIFLRHFFERWVGAALAIMGAGWFLYNGNDLRKTPIWVHLVALLVAGAIYYLHRWFARPRRTAKHHIGVVFAFTADSPEEEKRINEDFISNLRKSFDDPRMEARFDFIEIEKWRAAKIVDTTSAQKALFAAQGHILIWGSAKLRVLDGKEYHIINTQEIVLHSAVPIQMSQELSNEMALIFPQQVNVCRENDLIGLQITSEWLGTACHYFVAVAALMSGDLGLAESFLVRLHQSPLLLKLRGVPAVALRNSIRTRLANVYYAWLFNAHMRWTRHHKPEDMDLADKYADLLKEYAADLYSYHLFKAIACFVRHRDLRAAEAHIWECRKSADATWRLSKAFLSGYQGDLDAAVEFYNKATRRTCEHRIPVETESFMTWVLSQEPEKAQLHFCVGYLNWKVKGDLAAAKRDFEAFAAHQNAARFPKHLAIAAQFLASGTWESDQAA
jgi:hypothetical protein